MFSNGYIIHTTTLPNHQCMNRYLNLSIYGFLLIYCMLFIFFSFLHNYILIEDRLYYNSFSNIIAIDKIGYIIDQYKIYQKIGYGIVPIIILLRVFYTSLCLFIGSFISKEHLSFRQCFNVALKSDPIFLFELIFKINYFSFVGINTLQDLNTRILSAFQLLDLQTETWSSYPFLVLNLFELCYWIILASLSSYYTKEGFWVSILFILKSYGVGLILWIMFIVFIMLNFT